MFLRSLTLKGFKSFAEPTTLEFEPGVTVVVGPNGSGKSNIVDAVAWVLGALGPRTVRSAKMDDVIFAGGAQRPALGRAEVALTIDNSAGLLPIDLSEVTITRTLFRSSGESEYAINGVPCRLLDVQELLSDTGVGRQQHVIVSQGQLDSVLDARPEDRRLIVEEAAGILKFRRRKEKAERRLEATEANLLRLADLAKEVRRQLRPLERQADAARRHDDLAAELRALRVYLAGRELAGLTVRLDASTAGGQRLAGQEGELRTTLGHLDAEVAAVEGWLRAADPGGLTDLAGRYEALRERARGLGALLAERRRSIERERAVAADQILAGSLRVDVEQLDAEVVATQATEAEVGEELAGLAGEEAEVAAELAALPPLGGEGEAGRVAEIRGELLAHRATAERAAVAIERQQRRLAALEERVAELEAGLAARGAVVDEARSAGQAATAALHDAEQRRAVAVAEAASAQAVVTVALGDVERWLARTEALEQVLSGTASAGSDDRSDNRSAAAVAESHQALGRLSELVEVGSGWEAAFESAAGDAVSALVVEEAGAARRLLSALGEASPPVVALAEPPQSPPLLPPGCPGEPLVGHVRGIHPALTPVLELLVGNCVVVDGGWEDALDTALAYPDLVVLTRAGDRFSCRGWQRGPVGAAGTRVALEEARQAAAAAAGVLGTAEAELARLAGDVAGAEADRETARAEVERCQAVLVAATDDGARLDSEVREARTRAEAVAALLDEQNHDLAQAQARVGQAEAALAALEADEAADADTRAALARQHEVVEGRASALARRRSELEVRAAALADRRAYLSQRLAEVRNRLAQMELPLEGVGSAGGEGEGFTAVPLSSADQARRTEQLARLVAGRLADVERRLEHVRVRRDQLSEAVRANGARLDDLRQQRAGLERALEELRERTRRTDLDAAESRMRLEAAVEALRRELDCEPDAAMSAECPELPAGISASTRARELERELRLLGPVNPLAVEELTALEERHTFLTAQLDDVKASRRELSKVIRAVDAEMKELLQAALADVIDHYAALFGTLFPGGEGRLRLTEPEHLLDSGIEIEARPAGKKVRQLSLLSGGERSLCALAFLFAVFRSRPSPFYLLDEVEAALDDVNLHRFLGLLEEFRNEAQLLVVTHQKRTMEAADCLYGVTMQAGGTSRVLSERVRTRT